jgi:hypothetical protein
MSSENRHGPLDPYTYILVDRKPVQHPNNDAWFKWFGNMDNRRVALTMIGEEIRISTIFGGIDRSYGNAEQPLLFETIVFGGEHDQEEWLTATWQEAEQQHAEVVALIKQERRT